MLDNFILLAFNLALFSFYIITGLVIVLTIQLIAYRVFKKNPYKWIVNKLQLY